MSIKKYNILEIPTNFTAGDFSRMMERVGLGFKVITGFKFTTYEFEICNPFDNSIYIFKGSLLIKE